MKAPCSGSQVRALLPIYTARQAQPASSTLDARAAEVRAAEVVRREL
jgi:hypothetical protein